MSENNNNNNNYTMTAQHHRESIQLNEVFPHPHDAVVHKGQQPAEDMTASTDSPSDSDLSSSQLGASSSRSSGILRVATLEESLAHMDIERTNSGSNSADSSKEEPEAEGDDDAKEPRAVAEPDEIGTSQKSVSFAEVQVREYPFCLGDNPSVMIGAALTIDWVAQSEAALSLDDYEASRPERRRSEELRIPSFVREEMLRTSGYSRLDIQRGVKDVNITRNRRKRTNETHRLHKAQEAAERLVRGTLNATVRRTKKKQERELIEHFRTESAALKQGGVATRRSTWHAEAPATKPKVRRGTWAAAPNSKAASALRRLGASFSGGLDASGSTAGTNEV